MTEILKPISRQDFALMLRTAIAARGYRRSSVGPHKSAATEAQVSPSAIGLMCRGEFPRALANDEPHTKEKRDRGALFSLTRVCDTFGFDLQSCIEIFELPNLPEVIASSRQQVEHPTILNADDLTMLQKQVEMLGPLPVDLVVQLVEQFRSKK